MKMTHHRMDVMFDVENNIRKMWFSNKRIVILIFNLKIKTIYCAVTKTPLILIFYDF